MPPAESPTFFRLRGRFDDEERVFDLSTGKHSVGSSPLNDIRLTSNGVSRRHASLSISGEGLTVKDLGSKNGTFVDGTAIDQALVAVGATLSFGSAKLRVESPEVMDVELAMVFDPPSQGGDKDGTLSPESRETYDLGHIDAKVAAVWLHLLDGFAERFFATPRGEVVPALTFLAQTLGLVGTCLLEYNGDSEPLVVASTGQVGARTALDRASGGSFTFVAEEGLSRGWLTSEENISLELQLWGSFKAWEASGPLLRLLLGLLDQIRQRPVHVLDEEPGGKPLQDWKPRKDCPDLDFPEGYLPGISRGMREVYRQIRTLLEGDLPVLIIGETGVGKECLVELLHRSSDRRDGPLVALNCAAIPSDLLEAELFGIGKGVATGVEARVGKFQLAAGGTLFLDEIGEMHPMLQAKLLRALQEKQVQPVGGAPRKVDVRIVSATNANLENLIETGGFRADLFYRLAGFELRVPALRDVPEDLPPLIEHFLRSFSRQRGIHVRGVTVKTYQRLLAYSWPGNIRELRHELRRLVQLSVHGDVIAAARLSPRLLAAAEPAAPAIAADNLNLEANVREVEHRLISEALRRKDGRQLRAAELLGISRNHLATKIKRLGIDPRDFRPLPPAKNKG